MNYFHCQKCDKVYSSNFKQFTHEIYGERHETVAISKDQAKILLTQRSIARYGPTAKYCRQGHTMDLDNIYLMSRTKSGGSVVRTCLTCMTISKAKHENKTLASLIKEPERSPNKPTIISTPQNSRTDELLATIVDKLNQLNQRLEILEAKVQLPKVLTLDSSSQLGTGFTAHYGYY